MGKDLLVVALLEHEDLVSIVETKVVHVNWDYDRARVSGIQRLVYGFVAIMSLHSRIAVGNLCCDLRRCGFVNRSSICLGGRVCVVSGCRRLHILLISLDAYDVK